jgi:hypothetical protein
VNNESKKSTNSSSRESAEGGTLTTQILEKERAQLTFEIISSGDEPKHPTKTHPLPPSSFKTVSTTKAFCSEERKSPSEKPFKTKKFFTPLFINRAVSAFNAITSTEKSLFKGVIKGTTNPESFCGEKTAASFLLKNPSDLNEPPTQLPHA